jgi:hypothetical protein
VCGVGVCVVGVFVAFLRLRMVRVFVFGWLCWFGWGDGGVLKVGLPSCRAPSLQARFVLQWLVKFLELSTR